MQYVSSTYDLVTGSALISYRLSLSEHPWLAHYKVFDRVVFVGTGLVELALAAGLAAGSPRVVELKLAAPLIISSTGGSRVQVLVQAADAQGRRAFSLHSLDEASSARSGRWILHATGVLAGAEAAGREAAAVPLLKEWPPEGANQLDMSNLYARLSARGLDYGPAFQGLTSIWRLGEAIYVEVALPAGTASGGGEYGIHPALFDAVLHVFATEGFAADDEGGVLLPFAWSDVALRAHGASELRVRLDLSSSEDSEQVSASMILWDGTGQPVATVGCLTLRRAAGEQVLVASRRAGAGSGAFADAGEPGVSPGRGSEHRRLGSAPSPDGAAGEGAPRDAGGVGAGGCGHGAGACRVRLRFRPTTTEGAWVWIR